MIKRVEVNIYTVCIMFNVGGAIGDVNIFIATHPNRRREWFSQ